MYVYIIIIAIEAIFVTLQNNSTILSIFIISCTLDLYGLFTTRYKFTPLNTINLITQTPPSRKHHVVLVFVWFISNSIMCSRFIYISLQMARLSSFLKAELYSIAYIYTRTTSFFFVCFISLFIDGHFGLSVCFETFSLLHPTSLQGPISMTIEGTSTEFSFSYPHPTANPLPYITVPESSLQIWNLGSTIS